MARLALAMLPPMGTSGDFSLPPLGIACLAGYLRPRGFDVELFDFRLAGPIRGLGRPDVTPLARYASELADLPLLLALLDANSRQASDPLSWHDGGSNGVVRDYALERGVPPHSMAVDLAASATIGQQAARVLSRFDLVGLTVTSSNLYTVACCALALRRGTPRVRIVAGGPQITQSPSSARILLEHNVVDYTVAGEGETALASLLTVLSGRLDQDPTVAARRVGIPGLATAGRIEETSRLAPFLFATDLPSPDFTGLFLQAYQPFTLPNYASRGCPNRCAYCSERNLLGPFRVRPAEAVAADALAARRVHRTVLLVMADSHLDCRPGRLAELGCAMRECGVDVGVDGYLRADPDLIEDAMALGMESATLGVESLSDDILRAMNKDRSSDNNVRAISSLVSAGMDVGVNMICGWPGESQDRFAATVGVWEGLCRSLQGAPGRARVFVHTFQIRPGSDVLREPSRYGVTINAWPDGSTSIPYTFATDVPAAVAVHRASILRGLPWIVPAAGSRIRAGYARRIGSILTSGDVLVPGFASPVSGGLFLPLEQQMLPVDGTVAGVLERLRTGGIGVKDQPPELVSVLGRLVANGVLRPS